MKKSIPNDEYDFLKSNFINSQFCAGQSDHALEVLNKYTQESLAQFNTANDQQVEIALESSLAGFKNLQSMSCGDRAQGLLELAALLKKHKASLSALIVAEAGKPHSYAATEVDRSITTVETAATEATRFSGEVINIDHQNGVGRQAFSQRVARGPLLAISPFNFPLNLALHKLAPALAVGCSVILKPSSMTPLTALYIAFLLQQTSFPANALQVVTCSRRQAEFLIKSSAIKMISFTGSDKVGWHIRQLAYTKPVTLELGGNAAVIVDDNTDIQAIAKQLIQGAFLYAGQICISTQRVYAHKNKVKALQTELAKALETLNIGNPLDSETTMGPLINSDAYQKVRTMIEETFEDGAEILAQIGPDDPERNLHPAVILTNTKHHHRIIQEEAFGPVLVIESVNSFEEGIQVTNDSKYGLQVGVFTNDLSHMKTCFAQLEVGAVIINDIPGFRVDSMPYGGVKNSGLGREGPYYAMMEMTEERLLIF